MRAARYKKGSLVFDRRRKTWNILTWVDGKRKSKLIGTIREFPNKGAARRAADALEPMNEAASRGSQPEQQTSVATTNGATRGTTVNELVEHYRNERMPRRKDTRRSYEVWIDNHIVPKWGQQSITNLQARPVELWLRELPLSPKSKVHIRGILRILWDFAMWRGDVSSQRNPMELVIIEGSGRRMKQPRNLTVEEFQRFMQYLDEPFRTLALLLCLLRTAYQ